MSDNIEAGSFIEAGGTQIVVNDFKIPTNTLLFSAGKFTANLFSQGGIANADFIFHEDNNGAPGSVITEYTLTSLVPTSQEIITSIFDYDLHEVVFDFPSPITFTPATYWVEIVPTPVSPGTQIAWRYTTTGIIGNKLYFDSNETETWTQGTGDGIFTISGECTYTEECLLPEDLAATIAGSTSAEITWSEVGDATEWQIEYGLVGFTPGSGAIITVIGSPVHTVSDFTPGEEYHIYVKSICSDDESGYLGPANIIFDYCAVLVAGVLPITHVEFAGISNTSNVLSTLGHEYFLNIIATLVPGETYPISIQGNTEVNISSTFVVFIDWNQDYAFNNTDERYEIGVLTNSTGTDGAQTTGIITVPENAVLGSTRMRIIKTWHSTNQYAANACKKVLAGQVEDYTVNVEDLESSIKFMDYDFKMGPNPTNDIIQISSTENIQSVKVYNLLGQQILNNQTNVQSPQIDMTSLQNGVYLMEITIKDTREVFKIVKQ